MTYYPKIPLIWSSEENERLVIVMIFSGRDIVSFICCISRKIVFIKTICIHLCFDSFVGWWKYFAKTFYFI